VKANGSEVRALESATDDSGASSESVVSSVVFPSVLATVQSKVAKLGTEPKSLHRSLVRLQGSERETQAIRAVAMMKVSDWVQARCKADSVTVSEAWASTDWGTWDKFCESVALSSRQAYADIGLARSTAIWESFAGGRMVRETSREALRIAKAHTPKGASEAERSIVESTVAELLDGASVARARTLRDQWAEFGLGESADTAVIPEMTTQQKLDDCLAAIQRQDKLIDSAVKRLVELRSGMAVLEVERDGYNLQLAGRKPRITVSDAAARECAKHGIDPAVVVGTGVARDGEILVRDVKEEVKRREFAAAADKRRVALGAVKSAAKPSKVNVVNDTLRGGSASDLMSVLLDEELGAAELANADNVYA